MARDTYLEADPPYKRVFDLCVVVGAHLLLLPVFLLLWVVIPLAIWLDDRGPVFYTQLRVGKGGKPSPSLSFGRWCGGPTGSSAHGRCLDGTM